jgi:hypothetical protein
MRIPADARYRVCDDAGGQCQFLRLDLRVVVPVTKPAEK